MFKIIQERTADSQRAQAAEAQTAEAEAGALTAEA
jgi:hypothetical protein